MGTRGPVPKRSEERIRRNTTEYGTIDKIEVIGPVTVPRLEIVNPHPFTRELWDGMIDSGQAKYFEPSDWAYAKFALHFADKLLKSGKPSAQMLVAVNQMLTDLLVSEGSRRRVRLEVERNSGEEGAVLDVAEMFRQRLTATS